MAFKFIGRAAFLDYTPTSSPTAHTDFPVTNLKEYGSIAMSCKSPDTTQNFSIVIDKGSATQSVGVLIDDVNFTSAKLWHGSAADTTANLAAITITLDERTQRYRYFYDNTHSDRYIRIYVPSGQTTTDSTNYYRIGRVVVGTTNIELIRNIFYPYVMTAPKKYATIEFESGSEEVVNLGSYKIFQCEFGVGAMTGTEAQQWWTLDANDEDQLMVMYENEADTSKAYVVQRKGSVAMQEISHNVYSFGTYVLKEKV